MITTGIIAEYNPFHNGHKYLFSKARSETKADFLAVTMSGAFVQRGEPAVLSKRARVEQALAAGADLVLELPIDCAMASAQTFARGGVQIFEASGVVDNLYFGSEAGDINVLYKIADALLNPDFDIALRIELESGKSYPAARQMVLENMIGECANALAEPNNLLGVEYLIALRYWKSAIKPYTIARKGAEHDSDDAYGDFASAFACRNLLKSSDSVKDYVPEEAFEILVREIGCGRAPVFVSDMERAMIARLRNLKTEDYKAIRDVSEGLEYLLCKAVAENSTIDAITMGVKSKRYTYSRIRRILMHAYLGLGIPSAAESMPEYIRILGMRRNAAPLVKELRKRAVLPVIQHVAATEDVPEALKREIIATDIWGAFTPTPCAAGEDYRGFPIIFG